MRGCRTLAVTMLAFAFASAAQAGLGELPLETKYTIADAPDDRCYDAPEVVALGADLVVRARLVAVTAGPASTDIMVGRPYRVTAHVTETLKGVPPPGELNFEIEPSLGDVDWGPPDDTSNDWVICVDCIRPPAGDRDLFVLHAPAHGASMWSLHAKSVPFSRDSPGVLLDRLRDLLPVCPHGISDVKLARVLWPGPISGLSLTRVLLSENLWATGLTLAQSHDPSERELSTGILRGDRASAGVAALTALLHDPYAEDQGILKQYTREYPVRRAAYGALKALAVDVPHPVAREPDDLYVQPAAAITRALIVAPFAIAAAWCAWKHRAGVPLRASAWLVGQAFLCSVFIVTAFLWIRSRRVAYQYVWPTNAGHIEFCASPDGLQMTRVLDPRRDGPRGVVALPVGGRFDQLWRLPDFTPDTYAERTRIVGIAFDRGHATANGGYYATRYAWTAVRVPYVWPALLTGWFPARLAYRRAALRRCRKPGTCRKCGYDLRASSGRCPECETPLLPPKAQRKRPADGAVTAKKHLRPNTNNDPEARRRIDEEHRRLAEQLGQIGE